VGVMGSALYVTTQPRYWDVSTTALTAQVEHALKPGDKFKECTNCPEMVVVPSGSFMMGSPENEVGRNSAEGPQRLVTIATPFAVAKFEITAVEWVACAAHDGCQGIFSQAELDLAFREIFRRYLHVTSDSLPKPQNKVSWDKAKQYIAWIAKLTGKPYRLLTEAEW